MYITIAILVVFSVAFALLFAHAKTSSATNYNKRQSQKSGNEAYSRRQKIEMTPYNQRSFVEAKKQLKQGKPLKAAQIFESIGMTREAVKVLEHSGNIDAAARILIKARAVERAGYIFARNKHWGKAAMCFREADKKQELGLCLFEDKNYGEAMQVFAETGDFNMAAKNAELMEDPRMAALYHLKAENYDESIRSYNRAGSEIELPDDIQLQAEERDFLKQKIKEGFSGDGAVKIAALASNNSVLILELCDEHKMDSLKAVLSHVQPDDLDVIIRNINSDDASTVVLAQALKEIESHAFAGRLFEMLKDYESAAACYKAAGLGDKYKFAVEQLGSDTGSNVDSNGLSEPVFVLDTADPNQAELELSSSKKAAFELDEPKEILSVDEGSPQDSPSLDLADDPQLDPFNGVALNYKDINEESDEQMMDLDLNDTPKEGLFTLDATPSSESLDSEVGSLEGLGKVSNKNIVDDLDSLLDVGGESFTAGLNSLPVKGSEFSEAEKPVSKIKSLGDFISESFKISDLMSDLTEEEIKKIWLLGKVMNIEPGNELVGYHVRLDGLYTVLSGQLIRYVQENDEDIFVNHVSQSGSFGEFWLVGNLPNPNMWKADVQTKVHVLTTEQFSSLSQEDPILATKLYKRINEKLFQKMSENPSLKTSLAS